MERCYLVCLRGWLYLLQLLRILIIITDAVLIAILLSNTLEIPGEIINLAKQDTSLLPLLYVFIYWLNHEYQKTWLTLNSKPRP